MTSLQTNDKSITSDNVSETTLKFSRCGLQNPLVSGSYYPENDVHG